MVKQRFFDDYLLYTVVRGLGWVVRVLPLSWALACGRGFGTLAAWGQPRRRAVCLGNLRAAFGTERTAEELDRTCLGVFQQMGMSFVEVLRTPAIDAAYIERWITVEGRQHLDRALALRRGVVMVAAHLGNWELTNLTAGLKGYPASVLARPQGLPRLNRLLNQYRESKGCRVISKGMAVRAMVRQLRAGGIVGILADQDAGRHGVLAPFFGRLASTAQGPVALALDAGCPLLPVFIVRTRRGPAHTLHLEPPLDLVRSGRIADDVRAGVAAYLRVLERYVRRTPEQWLWAHRRWKSSPHRAVVALSDGKAGHRAQVVAAAELVAQVWAERAGRDPRLRGMDGPWTACSVIEVRYRAAWRRGVLVLAAWLRGDLWWPARRWLRWALTVDSRGALEQAWATVTVSSGASTAPVNLLWSRSLGARTIHVMRPPWPFARRVDLRIVPRHDRLTDDARTIVTHGALHATATAHPPEVTGGSAALMRPTRLGLLIGGDSRGVRLPPQLVASVVTQLLEAAGQLDAELQVTTSRRTASAVEALLERQLGQHPRCPVLIFASRDRVDGAVPRILETSSVIVVSGDSISMVSEAAAWGKPVLVFEPRAAWPWPKHRRFLASLTNVGAIRVVRPETIGQQVIEVIRGGQAFSPIDDRALVLNRLRQWL